MSSYTLQEAIQIGLQFKNSGDLEEAINIFSQIVEFAPDSKEVLFHLAACQKLINNTNGAIESYKKILTLYPEHIETLFNLANTYKQTKDFQNAIEYYKKCIEINPSYTFAHINLSFCYLVLDDFKSGFKEYEWRLEMIAKEAPKRAKLPQKKDIENKVVLIYCEQGFGDTIMFARFLPEIKKIAKKVYLMPQLELFELFKTNLSEVETIQTIENLEFECSIPIGSLPYLLGIDSKEQILNTPYIKNSYKKQYNSTQKVGFVYATNPSFKGVKQKSIDIASLESILALEGFDFYSFQLESETPPKNSISLKEKIKNFQDTANLINEMDILFSVDTAFAHLAGAMGRDVILLLPYDADWRWGVAHSCIWYPTVTILRQESYNDWNPVILKLRDMFTEIRCL